MRGPSAISCRRTRGLLAGAGVAAIPDERIDRDIAVPSNIGATDIAVGAIRSIIPARPWCVAVAASNHVRPGALGFLTSAAAVLREGHSDRAGEHRRKECRK